MKYIFTILFLMVVSPFLQAQQDFFLEEWEPKSFVPPEDSLPWPYTTATPLVRVTVYPDDSLRPVLPTLLGNNLPAWRRGLLGNTVMQEHVSHLGLRTLRIPGGNWSNTWLWDGINHWDGNNQDGYSGTFKDYSDTKNYLDVITSRPKVQWSATTDELLQICKDWNADPQICVNYALARYIDADNAVEQAAHYAAEWVRYVKRHGIKVKYWEIGNEHYGSWEAGYAVEGDTITGAKYGGDACVFIDSMKAADPDIKIGLTVYPAENHWSAPRFTPEVLEAAGNVADFLIVHDYFVWAQDPNTIPYAKILAAIPQIREDYYDLQALVRKYTNRDSIPTAMTEYNYFGGLKNTEGMAILFFSRALGEYASTPYGLVNYWDIQNGNGSEDHGMFTFNEEGAADYVPHPSFFPYFLFNKMFGDVLLRAEDDRDSVFVYSSRFSNGYTGVMVVNQGAQAFNLDLRLAGQDTGYVVYRYELKTPSLSSRKIYLNGATSPAGEWYGPRDYTAIPPYKAEAVDSVVATLEGYSVNFFVLHEENIPEEPSAIRKHMRETKLKTFPNPAADELFVQYHLDNPGEVSFTLYDLQGRRVRSLPSQRMPQGMHTTSINLSGLAPGIYLLRMTTPAGILSRRIVKK